MRSRVVAVCILALAMLPLHAIADPSPAAAAQSVGLSPARLAGPTRDPARNAPSACDAIFRISMMQAPSMRAACRVLLRNMTHASIVE